MKRLVGMLAVLLLLSVPVYAAGHAVVEAPHHDTALSGPDTEVTRITPPDLPAISGAAPVPGLRTGSEGGAAGLVRLVEVTYLMQIQNSDAESTTRDVTLTVPASVTSMARHQRVVSVRFNPEPESTEQTARGEKARYVIPELAPGATFTVQQTYLVELYGDAAVVDNGVQPEVDQAYLSAEPGIEVDNAEIRAKALEVTRTAETVNAKAAAIMDFVVGRIRYDGSSPNRNKGALAGFTGGSGVCTEYANLFVAMARANGIPARVVYGWAKDVPDTTYPTLVGRLDGTVRHAWAEYLDPERGWVPVDPTFATVRPQDERMAFDAANHVAQDFSQAPLRISYRGGRLTLVSQGTTLVALPLPQVVEVPAAPAAEAPAAPAAGAGDPEGSEAGAP